MLGPDVVEVCELRSTFGVMAYHGGQLEKVTDIVATEVAEATGASYYGLLHLADEPAHVPSTEIDPAHSPALADFLDHIDTVVTLHGYGRKRLSHSILLGGQNRELAAHIASHLRPLLPGYDVCDDLDHMPAGLRGLHPDNPVNRPLMQGVQVELPASIRWNWAGWGWSDQGEVGRAPQVDTLIRALTLALRTW
jgi:phage replication-related protein YjqB (UPF0714/DUF867 family)